MRAFVRHMTRLVAALLLTLVAGEALLRLLPVSTATLTGYHVDPRVFSYPPEHRWTASSGWDLRNAHRMRANNMGFAADRDFVRDPQAVALIGDSYVDASMLDPADRPGSQLERALRGTRPVYAMGAPGSSLLDYAERIRWAGERFDVRDFVVLMERGDVRQALCGSGNVHAACLDRVTLSERTETIATGGTLKAWLRRSALAQYLVSQLKLDPASLLTRAIAQSRPATPPETTGAGGSTPVAPSTAASARAVDLRVVDAIANGFFDRIATRSPRRLVIVIDSDRERLRRGLPVEDIERDRFIEIARARGAQVVDTQPVFAAHFARSRLRLDVGPYDGHLNRLGVELAMGAAAAALQAPRP